MLIEDLKNEQFEFNRVSILKNPITDKWEIKHKDEVICGKFITMGEARLWASKISIEVFGG